ncbi:MAG: Clp protease N-terminal domain-containing protein [Mycobacterium sp.]|nr:Clp protease N-terminal domain-containing protein [Mycobacterium sp.]
MFERFSRSARVAVVLAQEAARELHAEEIRPEHLLVGALQSAGLELSAVLAGYGVTPGGVRERLAADDPFDDDAEALRSIGIDLHEVRANIDRTFGADAYDNAGRRSGGRGRRRSHLSFTRSAKKTLELALREAIAHKHNWIGCEHIVLGVLRGGDPTAVALITEHVDAARLREGIDALFDAAA